MTITSSTFSNVNVGSAPNDGTGDPLRTSFIKINENFQHFTQTIWPNVQISSLYADIVSTYISQFNLIQTQTVEAGTVYSNVSGNLIITKGTFDTTSNITGAIGNVTHNLANGSVFNHNSISGNFRVNITNLSLDNNQRTEITVILNQGATPYLANAVQINGVDQTVKWKDGSIPSATANRYEVMNFALICLSGSYTVTGELKSFA